MECGKHFCLQSGEYTQSELDQLTAEQLFEKYSDGEVMLWELVRQSIARLGQRLERESKFNINHTQIVGEVLEDEKKGQEVLGQYIAIARNSAKENKGNDLFASITSEDSFYFPFLRREFDSSTKKTHVRSLCEDILNALQACNRNEEEKEQLQKLVSWLWYREIVRQIVVVKAREMALGSTIQPPEKEAKSEEEAYNSAREYWERKLYGTGIERQEGILFAQQVYYLASKCAGSLASRIFGDESKDIANLIIAVITIRTNNLVPRLREKSGKYVRLSELRQPILKALFDGNLEKAKELFIAIVNRYGEDVVTPYTLKLLGLSDEATNEVN